MKIAPEEKNESFSDSDDETKGNLEGEDNTKKETKLGEFARMRAELKEKVIKGVLENVLPDIGEYDIDGTVERQPVKWKGPIVEFLKLLGCWELNLHESVLSGSTYHINKALRKIEKVNKLLVNEYNNDGKTALSLAVKMKRDDIVTTLIDKGALADLADQKTGRSPLMHSVYQGTYDITKILIAAGASPKLCDFACVTPLMLAASNNDLSHVKLIASKLIDLDIQDENGWTALHYAAHTNAAKVIIFLINEGASRNLKDFNKRKPIHIAQRLNNGESISALEDFHSRLEIVTGMFE